nr:MAG: magnesium transporter [Hyphomicrobiales bacterium]
MASVNELPPWDRLRELASNSNHADLVAYLATLQPSEIVSAVLRLEEDSQEKVLAALSRYDAAGVIEDLPDEQAADIIERLSPAEAASIVARMQSDEQADLLADLDDRDAEAILREMTPDDAKDVRELSSYAENVAGGLMVTEFFSFPEETTADEVLEHVKQGAIEDPDYFTRYVYIVTKWQRLVGVVGIRELALLEPNVPLAEAMVPALFVEAHTPFDDIKNFFDYRGFAAIPVVDPHGKLLGAVQRRSFFRLLAERTEREMLRMQGIVGGDEIRTLPLLTRSGRRLSWLSINIVLNIVAASIIAFYIDTLDAVIALAVFLPIISDMSGCSGNQAVAVSMRELALGIVKPAEVRRVWLKEISVGLINGAALGVLLGLVAWAWRGNAYLGLVVGSALMLNTLVAVSIGGIVPLILKRNGVDPAVASGPILTTVTDMCGFFLVLSFAAMMLSKLT